jgi:SAM-dependent methyltransferase
MRALGVSDEGGVATTGDAAAARLFEPTAPRWACPECGGRLDVGAPQELACLRCGLGFGVRDGIHRFLTPQRAATSEVFFRQYLLMRERAGYVARRGEYYRMLPSVVRDDPRADEWRLRRESYGRLVRHALPAVWGGSAHILDLGAGNAWLSHRLASFGHRVVAVDQLDDDHDGLGARRHYPVTFTAVQADFDALPFEPGQFDLVIFGASLHYSWNPEATLAGARRMLAPQGSMVIMDSPMFANEREGRAMLAADEARTQQELGPDAVGSLGVGFLTFEGLERAMRSIGLHGEFIRSNAPLVRRLQHWLARLPLGPSPAAFGVWIAR